MWWLSFNLSVAVVVGFLSDDRALSMPSLQLKVRDRLFRNGGARLTWLRGLFVYLVAVGAGNLIWETAHLPLYTIWREGSASEQAFAVIHCTLGDILIALNAALLALVIAGDRAWPASRFWPVVGLAIPLGVGYTVYSEWLALDGRARLVHSRRPGFKGKLVLTPNRDGVMTLKVLVKG